MHIACDKFCIYVHTYYAVPSDRPIIWCNMCSFLLWNISLILTWRLVVEYPLKVFLIKINRTEVVHSLIVKTLSKSIRNQDFQAEQRARLTVRKFMAMTVDVTTELDIETVTCFMFPSVVFSLKFGVLWSKTKHILHHVIILDCVKTFAAIHNVNHVSAKIYISPVSMGNILYI